MPLRAEVVRKKLLQINVLTAEFRESVDQYREIPTRLAAHGVLTEATSARLASLSGFRNILVHDYAEIDLTKIHAGLDRLDDFDAFVADVERWLQQTSSG